MSRRWRVLGSILRVIVKMRAILNKVNKSREKMKLYYCCLFPNDFEFERETLVRLWMAMGFSSQSCIEKFCERYFDILLEEQYIIFSSIDVETGRNLYKVNHHGKDNMGEKKTVDKEDFYTMLEDEEANGSKPGHISLVSNCINETTFKKLQKFDGELRTLLFIHNYGSSLNKIPSDMFLILEFLRALDLSGSDIVELPRSIGNVRKLRYLDLSFTLIESLPESIDQLHQLQTLKLQGCKHLHELPKGIKELIYLRHLDLDVLGQLTFLPSGIGALTELCTLSAFFVDSKEGCTIRELKFLNKLRGSFCISGLENVAHVDDVQEAALQDKKYLTHLQLRWSDLKLYSTEDDQDAYNIIASLNLNKGLQDLEIVCYPGLHIPAWVDFKEQWNLLSITLLNCNNNDLSLPLGQLPNLKYLSIIHMNRVTKIDGWSGDGGDEAYVAFPKLEKLEIECMFSLETWIDVFNHDDFPFLSTLIIKQCPKLTRLPFLTHLQVLKHLEMSHCTVFECLPEGTLPTSLETLIIDDCPFLEKRCSKEGEDWHKVKHIPNIWIDLQEDSDFEDSSSTIVDICSIDEDVSEDINSSAGGGEIDRCTGMPENIAACSQSEIPSTDSANKELASAISKDICSIDEGDVSQDIINSSAACTYIHGAIKQNAQMENSANSSSLGSISGERKITLNENTNLSSDFLPVLRSGEWSGFGGRAYMEDTHVCIDDLAKAFGCELVEEEPVSFYGVFDGHGGKAAAQFVRDHLPRVIAEDADFPIKLGQVVARSFKKTDGAFAESCTAGFSLSSGTTALTAMIFGRSLLVANAGDSRAVLSRRGVSLKMSRDHRPCCKDERKRVESLGGYVEDGYLNGQLHVTRALGDWHLVGMKHLDTMGGPLSAEPELKLVTLTKEDEFLIIGSDGIWEVFSNQNAVDFVRRRLQRHNDVKLCCKEVVEKAVKLGTRDNLTVVIVSFHLDPPPAIVPRKMRFRKSISAEGLQNLRSFLEG